VETGRQIWRTQVELERGVQRSAFHRGGATIYNGKLFRVSIDNHVLALDMKTGKELWNQKFADLKDGFYATGGPIVANGVLISGLGRIWTACLPTASSPSVRRPARSFVITSTHRTTFTTSTPPTSRCSRISRSTASRGRS